MKKAHEKKMEVAEMKMLRWMCGVTRLDKIRNEKIRGTTKVGEISKKVQERRMRWYGHVMRRDEEYVGKRVMGIEVQGSRNRGRPKKRWADSVKDDLREKGLSGEELYDRADCSHANHITGRTLCCGSFYFRFASSHTHEHQAVGHFTSGCI